MNACGIRDRVSLDIDVLKRIVDDKIAIRFIDPSPGFSAETLR
jgi:hypothetical protein